MLLIIGVLATLAVLSVGIAFGREVERWDQRREAERDVEALHALERIHYFASS